MLSKVCRVKMTSGSQVSVDMPFGEDISNHWRAIQWVLTRWFWHWTVNFELWPLKVNEALLLWCSTSVSNFMKIARVLFKKSQRTNERTNQPTHSREHIETVENTPVFTGTLDSAPSPNFVAMATRGGLTTFCMVPLNRPSLKTPYMAQTSPVYLAYSRFCAISDFGE